MEMKDQQLDDARLMRDLSAALSDKIRGMSYLELRRFRRAAPRRAAGKRSSKVYGYSAGASGQSSAAGSGGSPAPASLSRSSRFSGSSRSRNGARRRSRARISLGVS